MIRPLSDLDLNAFPRICINGNQAPINNSNDLDPVDHSPPKKSRPQSALENIPIEHLRIIVGYLPKESDIKALAITSKTLFASIRPMITKFFSEFTINTIKKLNTVNIKYGDLFFKKKDVINKLFQNKFPPRNAIELQKNRLIQLLSTVDYLTLDNLMKMIVSPSYEQSIKEVTNKSCIVTPSFLKTIFPLSLIYKKIDIAKENEDPCTLRELFSQLTALGGEEKAHEKALEFQNLDTVLSIYKGIQSAVLGVKKWTAVPRKRLENISFDPERSEKYKVLT